MISRTRYFVIASLLVLFVGLGTGLLAYYVGMPATAVDRSGPQDLKYVPADTSLVGFVDVRTVTTSPLREKLRAILPADSKGQQAFASRTGIDIDADIDQIVAAASKPAAGETGGGLVLARGRFDVVKIESLMRERGGHVEEFQGKRLVVGNSPDGRRAVSVAFMEPGLIAIGSADMVRASASTATGSPNVTGNTPIMNLIEGLDPGSAWVAGRIPDLTSSPTLPAGVVGQLPAIQWFSASVQVDSGIRGTVRAQTKDDAAASSLRDVVRGLMALARLQSASHPEIDTALRGLDLGGAGSTVTLSFDIPGELFDLIGTAIHPKASLQQ